MKWLASLRKLFQSAVAESIPQATQLHEYLFVDERRLDAYVEQVHAPVTYDKVPAWGAELSSSGARVTAQQSRASRQLSMHEKITILMRYLRTTKEFAEGRPGNANIYVTGPVFRCETCEATSVFLPAKTTHDAVTRGFRLWISDRPTGPDGEGIETLRGARAFPGRLFLLEDDPNEDAPAPSYLSAFSTLQILAEVFTPRLLWSEEDVALDIPPVEHRFSRDPVGALRMLGGRVLDKRWITTLYRIRTGTEVPEAKTRSTIVTYAYPIFILAGRVEL